MFDLNKKYSSLSSLDALQENGAQFFSKVANKYPKAISCKEGCSKCCYVDLSVFEVEAMKILTWFNNLSVDQKNHLKNIWRNTPLKSGENANQEPNKSCAFLVDEKCSIYEARPLICRTQGAPLYFQELEKVDVCPLNFQDTAMPEKTDWLNVDRLNTLLSLVQNQYAKEADKNSHQRISLKELRDILL